MPLRTLVVASAFALSVGCGAAAPAPPGMPVAPTSTWRTLKTPQFEIFSNLDESDARHALDELTKTYDVLRTVVFTGAPEAGTPRTVVIFRTRDEFKAFAPRIADAYVISHLPFNPNGVPAIVFWGSLTDSSRKIVAHELSHVLTRRKLRGAPTWLNEGLAEYNSTIAVEFGSAFLGRTPFGFPFWKNSGLPTFAELRRMPSNVFYGSGGEGNVSSSERETVSTHYVAAWCAVHMMMNGPPAYRVRFDKYLDSLATDGAEQAWTKAFDGVDPAELQAEFERHLTRSIGVVWKTPFESSFKESTERSRELSASDVLLLQGQLLGPERDKSAPFFREAVRIAPQSARAHYTLSLTLEQRADRRRELELAYQIDPHDPDVVLALVISLEDERRTAGANAPPSERETALWNDLARVARTATQFNDLAWRKAHSGATAAALAFAKKSLQLEPLCFECLDTYAFVLDRRGDVAGACEAQRRAIDLAPTTNAALTKQLLDTLRRYEGKLAASPATAGAHERDERE